MAYNPTAFYSSRGAEYGQTGAAGRAAGIGDVLKEKAAAKQKTEAATDKLRKKGSRISMWQGFGNIAKGLTKAAIVAGKSINPIAATFGIMALKGMPSLLESMGVRGYEEVKSPEFSKKYDVYEPYEVGFEGAKSSIRGELGVGSVLGEGATTLLDLYTAQKSASLLEKLSGCTPGATTVKPDMTSAIMPNQQDMAKESLKSAFGAKDMTSLYDLLAGSDELDFFGDTYETATGASDWEKYYSDFMSAKARRG